ncbi:hypothetical protein [Streptodolium elevatio]
MIAPKTPGTITPKRKVSGRAKFWNDRLQQADNNRAMAAVVMDQARAIATALERQTGDDMVWYSLAKTLHDWCRAHDA